MTMVSRGLLAALLAVAPVIATAQDQPDGGPAAAVDRPQRGTAMSTVQNRFGEPVNRHPAVGQPPITRWDYPGFSVFFEHDLVIHAVLVRTAAAS